MRKFLMFFIFCFMATLVYADTFELPSKISAVTVYPGAAHLTRTLTLDLPAGEHTIIFDKIIPPIDENTLSVTGEGTANVKIYGGYIKQEFLAQTPDERVKELQNKIQGIDDAIALKNSAIETLDDKKEYLRSVKMYAGTQIPKELATAMPSIDLLKGVGNFISDELLGVETQKNDIRIKLRELNVERAKLVAQLGNIQGNYNHTQRRLAVDVGCTKSGKFTVHVAYLVNGANWRPLYDARTDLANAQVELTSFGVITQRTGEDWQDVPLMLSTSRPNLGGRMPYVAPWILQPYAPVSYREDRANGMVAAKLARYDMAEQYATTDAATPTEVEEKDKSASMAFSDIQQKGVSVTFKIPRPVSVKSDGSESKLPIATQMLKAEFQYSSYPKASAVSYLNSDVINDKDIQLLAGQVNLFLEGDFVGKSNIENVSPSEKFSLYLGVNENVKVKREQISKKVNDILIAGIPSPNRSTTIKMKITIENYESRPIKYNLFESMPVSENDKQIKSKIFDVSMEPTKKDWEDRKGVWQWVFDLAPKEKKEIFYTFMVEHPRDMTVGGI